MRPLLRAGSMLAMLLVVLLGRADAHGPPASLAIWGNYPTAIAGCQRAISHAAQSCGLRGLQARVDCGLAQLRGESCSQAATDARIQEARLHARTLVRRVCSQREVQILLYVDVDEALVDTINVCRQTEVAGFSAIFGPLLADGVVPPLDGSPRGCVEAIAATGSKALRFGIDQVQAGLNRIASTNVASVEKEPMVNRRRSRLESGVLRSALEVERHCGAEDFGAIYHRSPLELLTALMRHTECFGGGLYVQDEVICPEPICGNGVQEPSEDCDDGNLTGGDSCPATCQR